jgi:hypothetical protein
MRKLFTRLTFTTFALAAFVAFAQVPAEAQSATPQQIQQMIASGQEQAAIGQLNAALQAHPHSGVAWYLMAEAQDASGNASAAGKALANAEHYAPGLPFANPSEVAALQAHISGGNTGTTLGAPGAGAVAPMHHAGISPVLLGIVGLVVLFLVLRIFLRPRRAANLPGFPNAGYPSPYGPRGVAPSPGPYPYGPPAPGGLGGGLGSSLLGGLAAGAGFAAGERVIDDVFGHNRAPDNNVAPGQNFDNPPPAAPGWDDGLQGDPGWDSGSGGQDDNFDPNNSW